MDKNERLKMLYTWSKQLQHERICDVDSPVGWAITPLYPEFLEKRIDKRHVWYFVLNAKGSEFITEYTKFLDI